MALINHTMASEAIPNMANAARDQRRAWWKHDFYIHNLYPGLELKKVHEAVELGARDVAWRVLRVSYPVDPPSRAIFEAAVDDAYNALLAASND